jgi:plasmid stabilization system protein ParE
MFPFRIRPAAYADMDSIAEFIGRDNPERAESFSEELAHKIETVAERPLSFPARPEFGPLVRSALHGNYLILFLFDQTEVVIERVIHGARDIEGLF